MNGVNLHNESAYCESYEVHECMNDSIEIDQLILRIIFVYALEWWTLWALWTLWTCIIMSMSITIIACVDAAISMTVFEHF